jgi:predicted GNAT family acetyltransferase
MTAPDTSDAATLSVTRDDAAGRFEGRIDGRVVGVIGFTLAGDTVVVTHTGTPPELRGRGIAGRLTAAALADIRDRGQKVRPVCPYTVNYLDQHPEYSDLLR